MINTLVPWFGSSRLIAEQVGKELEGCRWVGVPFAGGMAELQYIEASTVVVSDLHREVINLAKVIADPDEARELARELSRLPYHADVLAEAQARCDLFRRTDWPKAGFRDFDAARDYFVCSWMGRSARAGTKGEFSGGLPVRWNANGGDSAVRYRSAVRSIGEWSRIMRRCSFVVMDAFDFLKKVNDTSESGVYLDPPFFEAGKNYLFNCGSKPDEQRHWHICLRSEIERFKACRVVMRAYDHPVIRELYPQDQWTWKFLEGGRKASNEAAPEVLILNKVEA